MTQRFRTLSLILFPLAAGIVALLSLIPRLPKPPVPWDFWDKIEHLTAYLILGFLGMLFFRALLMGRIGRTAATVLITVGFGGLLELLQPLTGRTADWRDFLMNAAGVTLGVVLSRLVGFLLQRRRQGPPRP